MKAFAKKRKTKLRSTPNTQDKFYAKASQQTDAIIVDPYFFFFAPSSKKNHYPWF
jgi:hypothetical protein